MDGTLVLQGTLACLVLQYVRVQLYVHRLVLQHAHLLAKTVGGGIVQTARSQPEEHEQQIEVRGQHRVLVAENVEVVVVMRR